MKPRIPWQAKVVSKVLLSRVPFAYSLWRKIGLFKHGDMVRPEYAYKVFTTHFNRSDFLNKNDKYTALELGPGDSVLSAILAKIFGASKCYLVDSGRYAKDDLSLGKHLLDYLKTKGHRVSFDLEKYNSLNDLIVSLDCSYMTNGLNSLRLISTRTPYFFFF